ncbi:sororin isoform X1 [Petromyzon marinus]|uniref:Sororin isoform X1 n=1 Tax=Petromyzon marinus TaxID=7757 RepID=A0AAJ7TIG4_PETMA|nr:sororin isoform X1 [Petromyzon marinus]
MAARRKAKSSGASCPAESGASRGTAKCSRPTCTTSVDVSSCSDMDVSRETRADSKRRLLRAKEAEAAAVPSPAPKKFAPRKTMASDLSKDSKSHKTLDPYDGDSENTSSQSDCPLSPKRRSVRLSDMETRVLSPLSTGGAKALAATTPMSQRVRRSYTRLRPEPESPSRRASHTSTPSEGFVSQRPSLFGFESLLTSAPLEDVSPLRLVPQETLQHLSAALDQTSLEQASPGKRKQCLPGIELGDDKARRKRCKIVKIGVREFEKLAAQMNAEFDEAEKFELIME